MGEDRRPNVAGQDPQHSQKQPQPDEHRRRLIAKSLGQRKGADGHEGSFPADVKEKE
jgi:hypothetical protein